MLLRLQHLPIPHHLLRLPPTVDRSPIFVDTIIGRLPLHQEDEPAVAR